MIYVQGDLLDFPVIAHQCNCTSQGSAGVARQIFNRFKINPYCKRRSPGTFSVDTAYQGTIIYHLFTQFKPSISSPGDSTEDRLEWLRTVIRLLPPMKTLAIPKFGCGLAGGNWDRDYEPIFSRWEQATGISITVVEKF